MCIEYVCIEKWSEGLGRSSKHRLMNILLGLTALKRTHLLAIVKEVSPETKQFVMYIRTTSFKFGWS